MLMAESFNDCRIHSGTEICDHCLII